MTLVIDMARTSAVTSSIELHTRLSLRHGGHLDHGHVGFRLHGNPEAPVVLLLGGISADRHVASAAPEDASGWWEFAVGDGRAIDTRHFLVLGIDWLGGAGASSKGAALSGVSAIATHDQAAAVIAVLDHLRIHRLHAAMGASYGGMVVLALAEQFPDRLRHAVVMNAAHETHPMATAIRSVQREIVRLGIATGRSRDAMRLARSLAMTTYRTDLEFAQRFDVRPVWTDSHARFPVQEYLDHHGEKFAERFDAQSFLLLSESNDLHEVVPESVAIPTLLIGAQSDTLVPPWQMRALAERLPACVGLHLLPSPFGHDAFLKEARFGELAASIL